MTFLAGDAQTALHQPYGLIISQSTAQRFFGTEDPIGKTIQSGDRYSEGDYIVTGVFQDGDFEPVAIVDDHIGTAVAQLCDPRCKVGLASPCGVVTMV